jgi:hypothetical protein
MKLKRPLFATYVGSDPCPGQRHVRNMAAERTECVLVSTALLTPVGQTLEVRAISSASSDEGCR